MSQNQTGGFTISRATRKGFIPSIGIFGGPGAGKTMSALLLARGITGAAGEIHLIDTESGRGSLYADVIPGGYSVLNLDPPFSPERYIEAMETCISDRAKIIVVDSMSHCWEGEGGVLEMAAENEERAKKKAEEKGWDFKPGGLSIWKVPKWENAKLIRFIVRSPVPIICCLRGKYKTVQKKIGSKTVIEKNDFISPIQESDFSFELTARVEITPDHKTILWKQSHPGLGACFPTEGFITVQHGEMIAKWCAAGGSVNPPAEKSWKVKFWAATEKIHKGDKVEGKAKVVKILREAALLADGVTLEQLTESDFEKLCKDAEHFI